MFLQNLLTVGLFAASFVPPTLAVDKTSNPELVAKLKTAATQLDRLALLPDDSDWVYDFTKHPYYTFAPGGVINANAATFPAVCSTVICDGGYADSATGCWTWHDVGHIEPWALLDASTALPSEGRQLRRCDVRYNRHLHGRRERCTNRQNHAHSRQDDDLPAS